MPKGGYRQCPFPPHRVTAKTITAFFSIDLSQIRGYGLADDATKLLITLSLWKIRKFLDFEYAFASRVRIGTRQRGEINPRQAAGAAVIIYTIFRGGTLERDRSANRKKANHISPIHR